jgi:hypothetical protein
MKMKKSEESVQCCICGKELIVPAHRARGVGPICAKKIEDNWDAIEAISAPQLPEDPMYFVCKLMPDGARAFNIRQNHVAHSSTGMGWGGNERGGRDYALNILLETVDDSETAVAMYGLFWMQFIKKLPKEGGKIGLVEVEQFVDRMRSRCVKTIEKLKSRELFEEKSNGKAD